MADEGPTTAKRSAGSRKRVFTKEIKNIMYGYGDVPNPADDTAEVMEDMLLLFMEDVCTKALRCSASSRLKLTDLTYVLRKDPKKLGRVLELIALDKELTKTRYALGGDDPIVGAKGRGSANKRGRFGGGGGDDDGSEPEDNNHYQGGLILPSKDNPKPAERDQDEEDDYGDF